MGDDTNAFASPTINSGEETQNSQYLQLKPQSRLLREFHTEFFTEYAQDILETLFEGEERRMSSRFFSPQQDYRYLFTFMIPQKVPDPSFYTFIN